MPFTTTERAIRAIARQVNHRPALKRLSHHFLRTAGASWVYYCTRNLLRVTNGEVLDTLRPDRGVILASNHRSLFDMYVLAAVLLRCCRWIRRMYFPVRSEYVYDRLDGLVLNALLSGFAMYPPIYRDAARRALNRATVAFVVEELRRPGTVVGLHPEGRRSTSEDVYTLLPAQPGVGEIIQRARPIVLPVFIAGMAGDAMTQIRGNFDGTGSPIRITFGQPVALDAYADAVPGPRTALRIAQAVRADIEALGAIDRRERVR